MKILVLVLGARAAPYPFLMRVIRRTWASVEVPETEVLFYRGAGPAALQGRLLTLPTADDLASVGIKTVACFEYVLEHRAFDVIFRTNCSSYVDLPNLRAFATAHARPERFYAGSVSAHEGVPFASGSGYFLSRDLVELVVHQQETWNHAVLDDVALGAVLARNGIEPMPAPRRDYRRPEEVHDVDTTQHLFRCRTYTWQRIGDAEIMVALHGAFSESRGREMTADLRLVASFGDLVRRTSSLIRDVGKR